MVVTANAKGGKSCAQDSTLGACATDAKASSSIVPSGWWIRLSPTSEDMLQITRIHTGTHVGTCQTRVALQTAHVESGGEFANGRPCFALIVLWLVLDLFCGHSVVRI